jgi:hypothetical protein
MGSRPAFLDLRSSGSRPIRSLTVSRAACLQPIYRSVVLMLSWPRRSGSARCRAPNIMSSNGRQATLADAGLNTNQITFGLNPSRDSAGIVNGTHEWSSLSRLRSTRRGWRPDPIWNWSGLRGAYSARLDQWCPVLLFASEILYGHPCDFRLEEATAQGRCSSADRTRNCLIIIGPLRFAPTPPASTKLRSRDEFSKHRCGNLSADAEPLTVWRLQ